MNSNRTSELLTVFSGGEALSLKIYLQFNRLYPHVVLQNLYGPTEATINVAQFTCHPGIKAIYIGRPVDNTKAYVLDAALQPVPVGVTGELYIGGVQLARGYLNRPELTAERFIANPFATSEDQAKGYDRLYKTGDLVCWLPDGNLKYIGRNDFQVKIRGYRIELGEIESNLNDYPTIKQSVVMVYEREGTKSLVAYYVAKKPISKDRLIEHLVKELPDYMIPSAFLYLEKMPMTSTGKLDRKALPEPEFKSEVTYLAPRNALEEQVLEIWRKLLHLEKISVLDDFFRLGGDSILSIQLSARLRRIGLYVNVNDIFEYRTIANIVNHIKPEKERIICAEQGILTGSFDLLPIQNWFFEQNFKNQNYFNQSFLVKVEPLDTEKLKIVIAKLAEQHDVLRLTFKGKQQTYQESIILPELLVLNRKDLSEEDLIKIFTQWQSEFNLENGPLWKIGYIFGYRDGGASIYVAMHHLIIDMVSWRILIEDIKSLYHGEALAEKNSSYRQWVEAVKHYAVQHVSEVDYWQSVIEGQPNYKQNSAITRERQINNIQLSYEKTKALLQAANQAYHTEINVLLLTALAYALRDWHKEDQSYITLEYHGREEISEVIDVSRTVGWFTTLYPVRLSLQATLTESIKYIKEALQGVSQKGLGYSALRDYGHSEKLKRHILPAISFNYLGQFGGEPADNWVIVPKNAGKNIDHSSQDVNIIDIYGFINEDQLQFSVSSFLTVEQSQALSQSFQGYLEEIIDHCVQRVQRKELISTPSDFYTTKLSLSLLDQLQSRYHIEAIYPANSFQQRCIYHAMSYPEDDAYRVQSLWDYPQFIDTEKLKQAWAYTIQCYPALRMAFNWEAELIQIVDKEGILNWFEYAIHEEQDKEKSIEAIRVEDQKQAFNLAVPGLLRLHLIKQNDNLYTFLMNMHHIILDGWSIPLLLNRVHEFYQLLLSGRKIKVHEETTYLQVQQYYYRHRDRVNRFWREKMQGMESANDLNGMLSRSMDLKSLREIIEPRQVNVTLTGSIYERLKALCRQQGITLNVLLQFAWHKLIQVYTGDNITMVGTTTSGRALPISGIEESVGLYINTLPLIVDWSEKSVQLQLQQMHQSITEMNNHSFVDLRNLEKQGQRLFHSLITYQNYPMPAEKGEIKFRFRQIVEKLNFLFSIVGYEKNGLYIELEYVGEYVNEEQAKRLLHQIEVILQQIPDVIHQSHNQLKMLKNIRN